MPLEVIKRLKSVSLPLTAFTNSVSLIVKNLTYTRGNCEKKIAHKIEAVLNRNVNLKTILKIGKIFSTKSSKCKFKYASITSYDVERCFSAYKLILRKQEASIYSRQYKRITVTEYCNINYNK